MIYLSSSLINSIKQQNRYNQNDDDYNNYEQNVPRSEIKRATSSDSHRAGHNTDRFDSIGRHGQQTSTDCPARSRIVDNNHNNDDQNSREKELATIGSWWTNWTVGSHAYSHDCFVECCRATTHSSWLERKQQRRSCCAHHECRASSNRWRLAIQVEH